MIYRLLSLEIRLFLNILRYNVIISVHDVTKKIWSGDSNDFLDVIIWSRFANCSIFFKEIIITLHLWDFLKKKKKTTFCSCCNFYNLGLVLDISWKVYTSLAKGLKLKVKKKLGLVSTFVEVPRKKLVGGLSSILKRVKSFCDLANKTNSYQVEGWYNFL